METFYKNAIAELRHALKQKDEELKSFKHRLAADVHLSIKTRQTESLNSPVTNSRLTEMYKNFKLLQWPKYKDQLNAQKMEAEDVKALIQKSFKDGSADMKTWRDQTEVVFGSIESGSGLPPQKIKKLKQFAIMKRLQSLYQKKEEFLKSTVLPSDAQYSQDVVEILRPLLLECKWMSGLLALANPPLCLDWNNAIPSMDPWAFFPQALSEEEETPHLVTTGWDAVSALSPCFPFSH
ncbi:uncharacterized protein KZ484_015069 [Pholidichthys leucotaenia]